MSLGKSQKRNDNDPTQKGKQATYHRNTSIWLKLCGIGIWRLRNEFRNSLIFLNNFLSKNIFLKNKMLLANLRLTFQVKAVLRKLYHC